MRKILFSALALMLGLSLASAALAVKPNGPSAFNGLNKGKSEMMHLELYEKDLNTWEPVDGGAFGRVSFGNGKFVFNGHKVKENTNFTLIRYNDPWPGEVVCLASGASNEEGDVHLSGEWLDGGVKVWLVLSADVSCSAGKMVGWHGAEYLFEYNTL